MTFLEATAGNHIRAPRALSPHNKLASFGMIMIYTMLICSKSISCSSDFLIGLGSYDITGPAADVNFMGYANPSQTGAGIHFRLRARTFVIASHDDNRTRFAYVNLDACMGSDIVTLKVLESLKTRFVSLTHLHPI
jgi:neutral ceramidase